MARETDEMEELRDAIVGNGRGREVEVDPSGEIHTTDESEEPPKPSRMSPHTFGA